MESYVTPLPKYNDSVFRLCIGLPVAFLFVLYGEKDHTFFEAILHFNFWIAIGATYIIVQLLMLYINWLPKKLDKHYRWRRHALQRTLLQFMLGLLFPALFAFYLAALYFWLFFGINIHDTLYLQFDYTLVVLLLVVANVYYLCYYLWLVPPVGFVPITLAKHKIEELSGSFNTEGSNKRIFLAQTKDKTIAIPSEDIAAIFIEGEYILLRTFGRETHTIIQSLTRAMDELDARQFFRINPRFIVNIRMCKEHHSAGNGNRELLLGSPLNRTEKITRSRVQEFNEWLVR